MRGDLSMDFIKGLLRSRGVDYYFGRRGSFEYGHFIRLRHPFTALVVVEIFIREAVRLHGIPCSVGIQMRRKGSLSAGDEENGERLCGKVWGVSTEQVCHSIAWGTLYCHYRFQS